MVVPLLVLLFALCSEGQSKNQTNLDKLEEALYKGFDEVWPFPKRFPTVTDLRVKRTDLYEGIANLGQWTEYSLRKIIEKVLDKKKIKILIVGESISAGANLGCHNNKRTFHYGLVMWWLKTIVNATGSRLARHQVAVGGVATNYFDRCWKEYLNKNESFDLVLWEFAFNDFDAVNQSRSLERFTLSVANLPAVPGLIFVSFFRKTFFEQYVSRKSANPCDKVLDEIRKKHETHELTIATVASYYGVTLLDLERTACSALERNSSTLSMQHMFSTDHPSFLAHAQMTFILIHYLRATFANIVKKMKAEGKTGRNATLSGFKRKLHHSENTLLPRNSMRRKLKPAKKVLLHPLYLTEDETGVYDEPICWTAVLPNIHKKPKHDLFDLKTTYSHSFKKIEKMGWQNADEKRYDATGGFYTSEKNQTIRFDFTVPTAKERTKWQISVAIRNKFFGGEVELELRDHIDVADTGRTVQVEDSKMVIDSSTKHYSGVNVYDLPRKTVAGKKTLVVKTMTGGVHICAIVIS